MTKKHSRKIMNTYKDRVAKHDRLRHLLKIQKDIDNNECAFRETDNCSGADRLIHRKSYFLINKKTKSACKFEFLITGPSLGDGYPDIIMGDKDCKTIGEHRMSISGLTIREFLPVFENMVSHEVGSAEFSKKFSLLMKLYMHEIEYH
jgi:hypothetical protein